VTDDAQFDLDNQAWLELQTPSIPAMVPIVRDGPVFVADAEPDDEPPESQILWLLDQRGYGTVPY
jgi:hypothetical protein